MNPESFCPTFGVHYKMGYCCTPTKGGTTSTSITNIC